MADEKTVFTRFRGIRYGPKSSVFYEFSVFRLANLGFDIWLLNNRGLSYSRGHSFLNNNSSQYWNFSFHELGVYDVPNTINYILNKTGHKSLYLFGHSQGGTVQAVMLSKLPEYNKKVKLSIQLAPGIYVNNMIGAWGVFAKSNLYNQLQVF